MTRLILLVAISLLASPAFAADGDFIGSCKADGQNVRGEYSCNEYYLCSDKEAADTVCDEFDLAAIGWPNHYVVEIDAVGACSAAPEVVPVGKHIPSGNSIALTTTALAVASKEGEVYSPVSHRIIAATLANMTNCAAGNGLDVIIRLFYTKDI